MSSIRFATSCLPTTISSSNMGLKIDHIVDAVKPLFRLPFSPLVLLALAAQRSPPLLESLTALRHKPNAEALKIIFGQLKTAVRGNVWLKVGNRKHLDAMNSQ